MGWKKLKHNMNNPDNKSKQPFLLTLSMYYITNPLRENCCTKKRKFPVFGGFGHIYWRNPEWKASFLCKECSPLLHYVPIFYSFCYRELENIETACNTNTKCSNNISLLHLIHLFPMHHFFTPWEHQKIL